MRIPGDDTERVAEQLRALGLDDDADAFERRANRHRDELRAALTQISGTPVEGVRQERGDR